MMTVICNHLPVSLNNTDITPFEIGSDLGGLYIGQWNSSEHLYQALKFADTCNINNIRNATMNNAIKLGHRPSRFCRPNITDPFVRTNFMYKANMMKYLYNDYSRGILLSTNDNLYYLSMDSFWGIGSDSKGKNVLGKILMFIRDNLRCEKDEQPPIEKWLE